MPFFRFSKKRLLLFLAVLGPGIITASVDNDAGGVATYSSAGAHFGYTLLWTLIPIMIALIVVQEMVARMGVVTGKTLADLIREKFGVRPTFFLLVAMIIANLGNTVAEFAGWASAWEIFGVSKYLSIPLGAAAVWFLVVKGTSRVVEKVFLVACAVFFTYPVAAWLAAPDWGEGAAASACPPCGWTRRTTRSSSGWWGPPSPRGCSSTCSPPWWRRTSRWSTTRSPGST